jgi:hypothetical protein
MTPDEEENLRKALNAGSNTEEFKLTVGNSSALIEVRMDSKYGVDITFDTENMNLFPEEVREIWKNVKRFYNLPEP